MNHLIGATLLASLVILLLGYFLGCLNGSVMVSHFIIKDDVRQHGSGNAGLTNFYRTYGAKYALGVISMPVTTFFFCGRSLLYTALAVLIAALVIWCHRENITRLLHHQERKFQWHTGTPKEKE